MRLIEYLFNDNYVPGSTHFEFDRAEFEEAAQALGIKLPKNLGDIVYSFRYRAELPKSILDLAPEGMEWTIRPAGTGRYAFSLSSIMRIRPQEHLSITRLPDSTPGVIDRYALSDEQALLARVRYNRLIDIFTGLTCYSLQSHLRTTVKGMGQIESDEIYVGIDKQGAHYVVPIEAKSTSDNIGIVQIEQDFAMCEAKFAGLVALPLAAKYLRNNVIALFSFARSSAEISILSEHHYLLVPQSELTRDELERYKNLASLGIH
jgi:hypothetical protein